MTAGATLAAFCGYAIAGFQSLYLQRTFELSAGEASLWVNAPAYAAGAVGTVITGWLAMKMRARSITAIAWLPAIGLAVSVPFYIWGFTTTSLLICARRALDRPFREVRLSRRAVHDQPGRRFSSVRATSTAVMLFIINILGYGLGPPFAGILSDFFFRQSATAAGFPGFTNAGCDAAAEAIRRAGAGANVADVLAGLARPISEAQLAFCGPANSQATQTSMLVISALYAVVGPVLLALHVHAEEGHGDRPARLREHGAAEPAHTRTGDRYRRSCPGFAVQAGWDGGRLPQDGRLGSALVLDHRWRLHVDRRLWGLRGCGPPEPASGMVMAT